jgi:segregation and condensation protein A
MSFQVELTEFRGPLDLLLFLVRKHEVEIADLPIAPITEQFLQYLEVLQELNVNDVGDFVEMASTLIEIKSRSLLPHTEEIEEPIEDPRQDLVRRLLEYKRYKDAASMLEERGRKWQDRFPRLSTDLPPRTRDLSEEPIREVELWDLVSAFGRILREQAANSPSNIVYDDTPIHVYMERIHSQLLAQSKLSLTALFQPCPNKSAMIGLFLATMELVRHHGVRLEQSELFDEIWILPGDKTAESLDVSAVDNYERKADAAENTADRSSKKPRRKKQETDEN